MSPEDMSILEIRGRQADAIGRACRAACDEIRRMSLTDSQRKALAEISAFLNQRGSRSDHWDFMPETKAMLAQEINSILTQ